MSHDQELPRRVKVPRVAEVRALLKDPYYPARHKPGLRAELAELTRATCGLTEPKGTGMDHVCGQGREHRGPHLCACGLPWTVPGDGLALVMPRPGAVVVLDFAGDHDRVRTWSWPLGEAAGPSEAALVHAALGDREAHVVLGAHPDVAREFARLLATVGRDSSLVQHGGSDAGAACRQVQAEAVPEWVVAEARIAELERDKMNTQLVIDQLRAEIQGLLDNPGDQHHTMEELYRYRLLYNAHAARGWVASGIPVVKSLRHHDGELAFGGGWFIVVAELPSGQVSNHYRSHDWDMFDVPDVWFPPVWDGHTPAVAEERLRASLRREP